MIFFSNGAAAHYCGNPVLFKGVEASFEKKIYFTVAGSVFSARLFEGAFLQFRFTEGARIA